MAETDSITYTLSGSDFDVIHGKLHSLFIVLQGLLKFREDIGEIEEVDIKVALDAYQDLYAEIIDSVKEGANNE